MEVFVKIAQFLLSLSILVLLHEMGHFIFAKLFKTRVEKFYLFFNPWFAVFKFKKGDTEYGLGWLPLGGYVKISGMIDESMDKEQLKKPPQPYEFRSKPAWQRLFMMLGGVLVNFILALCIYSLTLYLWGETYLPNANAKYGIAVIDTLGYEIGLKDGDKIISVDNTVIEDFHKITPYILLNEVKTIQVSRNDSVFDIVLPDDFIKRLIKKKASLFDARTPFVILGFPKESVAEKAGFKEGDKIVKFNDIDIQYYDEVRSLLSIYKLENVRINVERNGKIVEIPFTIPDDGLMKVYREGASNKFFTLKTIHYKFFESIPAGIKKGFSTLKDYLKQFKLIFSRETQAYKEIGGFGTIASIFPGKWNWAAFWELTALLSIILAIMNLLPIPALDGGHVLFLLFEMITGKKPGDKFMEYAQITGMIILIALLLYANGNDVVRWWQKMFAK